MKQKLADEQQTSNYYPLCPQYNPSYEEDPINPQDEPSHFKLEEER